jgi:hypothetical protein
MRADGVTLQWLGVRRIFFAASKIKAIVRLPPSLARTTTGTSTTIILLYYLLSHEGIFGAVA